jgi:hypothetical protein
MQREGVCRWMISPIEVGGRRHVDGGRYACEPSVILSLAGCSISMDRRYIYVCYQYLWHGNTELHCI